MFRRLIDTVVVLESICSETCLKDSQYEAYPTLELLTFNTPIEKPPTLDQLEKIPYLMAVMYESLRMFYGVTHRLSRIFPDRAMHYKSWTIPPGTPVSMSVPLIQDNEDIFPEPYSVSVFGSSFLSISSCFRS